jgi:hypothetical protein
MGGYHHATAADGITASMWGNGKPEQKFQDPVHEAWLHDQM